MDEELMKGRSGMLECKRVIPQDGDNDGRGKRETEEVIDKGKTK